MSQIWEYLDYTYQLSSEGRSGMRIRTSPVKVESIMASLNNQLCNLGLDPKVEEFRSTLSDKGDGSKIILNVSAVDALNALSADGWEPMGDLPGESRITKWVLFRRLTLTDAKL